MIRAAPLLLLMAGAAHAQDRPSLTPTRDVDVTYRMTQGGQTLEQRTRWQVGERRMRVDTPTPGVYMIVDYAARRMSMVSDADRGVVEVQANAGPMPGQVEGQSAASFVRQGSAQVAGLPCTEWRTLDSQGAVTLACITADGVLLRAQQAGRVLVEAARVAYGAQDPNAFRVPDSYARAAPPGAAR